MKLCLISDIHNKQNGLKMPEADVLVCAGDLTGSGTYHELKQVASWFYDLRHKYKHRISICGNHDFCFEDNRKYESRRLLEDSGVIYLQDSEVYIDGIKFYGMPWTPYFFGWAFNGIRPGGSLSQTNDPSMYPYFPPMSFKTLLIPKDTDVLITHGPPAGILDKVWGKHVGCEDLRERITKLPNLKLNVFGHLHEQYGRYYDTKTGILYVNASVVDFQYKLSNQPVIVEV